MEDRVSAGPGAALLDLVLSRAQVRTYTCSRQKWERGYELERRMVPDYNLIYVQRGRAVWEIEQEAYELSPGALLVVPPGVWHEARSLTRRITIGSIHVLVRMPGGQDVFELLRPPVVRRAEAGGFLERYLNLALAEWDRTDLRWVLPALGQWSRLIVPEMLREDAAAGRLRPQALDPLIAYLLEELNRRLEEAVSLEELARWAGYTPQHINRVFRRALGLTPLQYLARMKMDRAAVLLAEGELTVKAVARRVGVDDAYYFSRLFKQRFGRSPAQYRQALEPGAELG
jgi:AraC-like DNA-binding protein/quercetin dioxygenase-like cupin family protein